MKFNANLLAMLAISGLMTGCDSESINKVKDSVVYSVDNSLTLGNAFKTRSDCIDGKWTDEKDNRGRYIVTYSCEISPEGISAIDNYLLNYPRSWANSSIAASKQTIKFNEGDITKIDTIIASITKQQPLIKTYMDELYKAYESDDLISSKLYFYPYLDTMLGLTRTTSKGVSDADCDGNNFVEPVYGSVYRSDIDVNYVSESCIKNLLPIFKKYEENVRPLSTPELYDYYTKLRDISYSKNDFNTQKSLVIKYMDDTLAESQGRKERLTANIEETKLKIEKTYNQLEAMSNEIKVSNVRLTYSWLVSDTAGVDYLGGILDFDYKQKKYEYKNNNIAFIKYAYQEFNNGEIPKAYALSIFDVLRYDIENEYQRFKF